MRRRLRTVAWIAAGAFGLLVAFVAWEVLRDDTAPFREKVAELRARGFVTDLFTPLGPELPPGENGADDLFDGLAWFDANLPPGSRPDLLGCLDPDLDALSWQRASAADRDALVAALDLARPAFERMAAGAAKARIRFPPYANLDDFEGWPLGRGVEPPLRVLILLGSRAGVGAATDRSAACRDLLRLGARLGPRDLSDARTALRATRLAASAMRRAVTSAEIPAADLRARLDAELRPHAIARFPELARAEVAWLGTIYPAAAAGRARWANWSRPVRLAQRLQRALEREGDLHVGYEVAPSAEEIAHALDVWADRASWGPQTYLALRERLAGPDEGERYATGSPLATMLAHHDAVASVARVALAVADRHARTGAWPASLDELRDAFPDGMPTDPFTDAPFVYTVTDKTVRIAATATDKDGEPLSEDELRDVALLWEFPR